MMNRNSLTMLLAAGVGNVAFAASDKPNLVIIHTDEHNFRTLSCYQKQLPEDQAFVWGKGCNVETPNIDRIADEGMICMKYYASSPVSTPSRASLISGTYPKRSGAWKNGQVLRDDIPTFASLLAKDGYSTSYVGKWHLSEEHESYRFGIKYNGGFTDNRYMMAGGHAPYFVVNEDGSVINDDNFAVAMNQNTAAKHKGEYIHLTDFFTDRTIDIIERDKDKPFCLMVSIPDPHTPDYATPPYNTMYKDMDLQMPKTMEQELVEARPEWAKGGKNDYTTGFNPEPLRQYFGMVKHIDDSVGRIIEKLEQEGILDNTILIFTADHGEMFYEHMKKNKGCPYEASTNIPFVIRYPKAIPAGVVLNKPYTNCDFAPTMLSLIGVKYNSADFDGEDTSADFCSKTAPKDSDTRIVHFAECNGIWAGVANNRYKLIVTKKTEPWMFDLKNDPFELKNVYNTAGYESISAEMMSQLKKDIISYQTPLPGTTAPKPGWRME